MPVVEDQLDLAPGIGQRQATFRFALIDAASGRLLGDLSPVKSAELQHDTSRTIVRSISGLLLNKAETAEVDVLANRIQVFMRISGVEFQLGTYVFTDTHRTRTTAGRRGDYGLQDLGFVISQNLEHTVSFGANINVGDAISDLLAEVNLPAGFEVEATGAVLGSPIAWPAGTDRGRVLEDLARLGAYLSPYMGNDSVIRVRQAFDPAGESARFVFAAGGRVRNNTISESDDLLETPNAFIVVDNANTVSPVVGRYDVPVTAPHSAANRGFVVAEVTDIQGLGTTANADAAARAIGFSRSIYQHVVLATPPDPRHEAYDVISYDGFNWLETAWSLPLIEGGEMTHTLSRAYDPNLAGVVSSE